MPIWLNRANFYIVAWCIYSTQGILFPKGFLFTQLLLFILLMVSLYYLLIANTRYKLPVYFLGLNTLLGMLFIYGLYLIIGGYNVADYSIAVPSYHYLKNILISLSPIYPFFVFSKEGLINEKFLRIWLFVLIGITVINYFQSYQEQLYLAMLNASKAEEFTINVGYGFLSLIPICVFLYKKPVLQYIALGICMIFLFMAMKRGAIFIGVFCLFWFMWTNLKNTDFKKKVGIIFFSMALCLVGYLFVEKQIQESFYFQKRIENTLDGNSSGRDKLYSRFVDYFWNETTSLQFLFGSGANATLKVSYNYAHNDWLEIAVNQGIFGLIVYIFYWFLCGKTCVSKKYDFHVKSALQLLFMIYFLKTIFSMSYGSMGYIPMLSLGYCLAQEKENE